MAPCGSALTISDRRGSLLALGTASGQSLTLGTPFRRVRGGEQSFADARANGKVAPKTVIRPNSIRRLKSTRRRPSRPVRSNGEKPLLGNESLVAGPADGVVGHLADAQHGQPVVGGPFEGVFDVVPAVVA